MSRPRKPTALKAAEGNRGRRPLNTRELLEGPEAPDCPDWLDDAGKEAWERITTVLFDMGVIGLADEAELSSLCSAISTLKAARKQLDAMPEDKRLLFRTPNGSIQINPLISIINRQAEIIHRIASEFGMTPASRNKLLTDEVVPPSMQSLAELLDGPVETRPDDPVM
jgi:P27 family predicted phage terminase small subunit